MNLRDYQKLALTQLYDWFRDHKNGNPVLAMPGGSGKSIVIASIAADALKQWPDTRVLMLVRSQELVDQNADKLRKIWPNAPLGIICSSLNKREWGEPITYASPGSISRHTSRLGHQDLVIIDEAHMVSSKQEGSYRQILDDLWRFNPSMRVIGFSASPYRLGHGFITEGSGAIFSDILDPVSIEELVFKDYLVPLRSKITTHKLETDGLHKRQGEYITSEMEAKFNTIDHNRAVVKEIAEKASNRSHWLIFCSGVAHSEDLAEYLRASGIPAEGLDARHSKLERERKLADFESGKLRAICNVGILTTGYDFPALDCIVFLRSTMSPGLYLQMAVRGMRPSPGKTDCLVLDFAGCVEQHGPITAVQPPKAKGIGEAPVKVCENCQEIVHLSAKECPACGEPFPSFEAQEKEWRLRNDDIMGIENSEILVTDWNWQVHTSRTSGKEMVKVTYYGGLSDPIVTEYLPLLHGGFASQKSLSVLAHLSQSNGAVLPMQSDLDALCDVMNESDYPDLIEYKKDGKFYRVIKRVFDAVVA